MKLKNGMKVIAPIGCCDYLTEGKEYEVFNVVKEKNNYTFNTVADIGESIFSRLNDSIHLNDGNWIIKQETKIPRNLTTTTVEYKNCTFDVSGVWIGSFNADINEKPEFELHTIEINGNDLTELLTHEDRDGIVEILVNQ
jgi:hypothetical protein